MVRLLNNITWIIQTNSFCDNCVTNFALELGVSNSLVFSIMRFCTVRTYCTKEISFSTVTWLCVSAIYNGGRKQLENYPTFQFYTLPPAV